MGALHCPTCGAPNDCAVARDGHADVQCWCMDTPWPALALPERGEVASCLCRSCLQAQAASDAAATARG